MSGRTRLTVTVAAMLALASCTSAAPTGPAGPTSATGSAVVPVKEMVVTPDFDGDGGADVVAGIGDNPGRVSVRYANGGTLDFGRTEVDSARADSVTFGLALLARDLNQDGFTDLVVADPDSGGPALFWIYGSATGLDLAGRVATPTDLAPGAGRALALVAGSKPAVVVGGGSLAQQPVLLSYPLGADGRPGADPERVTAQSLGLPALGPGSRFGTTLAATGTLLAIGAPGATVGTARLAGAVYTVDYGVAPVRARRLTQDSPQVPDNAQSGDRFGAALAAGDGYVAVGVPGEDRNDESGHNQPGTGAVQVFKIAGTDLQPQPVLDQNDLPGNVEAGDAFGSAVSMVRPCDGTVGVLIGALAEAIGTKEQAGSVWVVPVGGDFNCGAVQLYDGAGLGEKAEPNTHVGSAVSVLRLKSGGDTLVIVAQGTWEEGVPGRVLTLDFPYQDEPVEVLKGLALGDEGQISLSPPEG